MKGGGTFQDPKRQETLKEQSSGIVECKLLRKTMVKSLQNHHSKDSLWSSREYKDIIIVKMICHICHKGHHLMSYYINVFMYVNIRKNTWHSCTTNKTIWTWDNLLMKLSLPPLALAPKCGAGDAGRVFFRRSSETAKRAWRFQVCERLTQPFGMLKLYVQQTKQIFHPHAPCMRYFPAFSINWGEMYANIPYIPVYLNKNHSAILDHESFLRF